MTSCMMLRSGFSIEAQMHNFGTNAKELADVAMRTSGEGVPERAHRPGEMLSQQLHFTACRTQMKHRTLSCRRGPSWAGRPVTAHRPQTKGDLKRAGEPRWPLGAPSRPGMRCRNSIRRYRLTWNDSWQ